MSEQKGGEYPVPEMTTVFLGAAAGMVGGAAAANSFFRPNVEFLPGITAKVSLDPGTTGADVAYGPTAAHMPDLPSPDLPIIGHTAVHADITALSSKLGDSETVQALASLAAGFDTGVGEPVEDAIIGRLVLGVNIGSVIGIFASYQALGKIREIKESRASRQASQIDDRLNIMERLKNVSKKRALALAASAFMLSGVVSTATESSERDNMIPVNKIITSQSPAMEGAGITGFGGDFVNTLAYGAVEYINGADEMWNQASDNFLQAHQKFAASGAMDFADDPNIVPMLHISDIHCNYAYMKHFLGPFMQKMKPQIVLNTGDTFTNSATTPLENDCYATFTSKVASATLGNGQTPVVVNVNGNHDPKKPIQQKSDPTVITLSKANGYKAEINSLAFVGDSDPKETILKAPDPSEEHNLDKLIAKQGRNIADTACAIQEETGERPIVLAHRRQATWQAIVEGCVSMSLSGHTHDEKPMKLFRADDGNTVLQHTGGSASGANVRITFYEAAKKPAASTLLLYDKTKGEVTGYITCLIDTGGNVQLKMVKTPTKPIPQTEGMRDFLAKHVKGK